VDGSRFQFHPLSTAAIFRFCGLGGRPIYESELRELALQPPSSFLLSSRFTRHCFLNSAAVIEIEPGNSPHAKLMRGLIEFGLSGRIVIRQGSGHRTSSRALSGMIPLPDSRKVDH
jgi:hypothetical protein